MSAADQSAVRRHERPSPPEGALPLDFLIALDRRAPLRAQIEGQLREGVRSGRLHAGTALPSSRALARELGVSRGVVVDAYAQLVAEGYLVSRQGSATRVARVAQQAPAPHADAPALPAARFDFRCWAADLMAFPRRQWAAALRTAVREAPVSALGYVEPAGLPTLRAGLAAYLGRARGVVADADRLVVTAGIQQALGLLAAVLRAAGRTRVAVEDPGFVVHRDLLARCGLEVVPVAVDEHGLVVDALPGDVGAVLVTPAHQFPLGWPLAPARRAALVEWAVRHDAIVIEDDYDGEYRYDREPLGAVQGLDPARVVYLGSASKALAPGLRLGWAVVPPELFEPLREEKGWADAGVPTIEQLALAGFVERGDLDRHLRRMRAVYRRRRDVLVAQLREHAPELELLGVAAGLHQTVRLPAGTQIGPLGEALWERGVALFPFEHDGRAYLPLGYSNIAEPAIAAGIRALIEAVRSGSERR